MSKHSIFKIRVILFLFGTIGFMLSAFVHFSSLNGINLENQYPIFLLHIGIFIVFIPSIIVQTTKKQHRNPLDKNSHPVQKALSIFTGIFIVYTIFNFIQFSANSSGGTGNIEDGKYYISGRGIEKKEITQENYNQIKANIARGFSGHWMLFYLASITILFPFGKLEETDFIDPEILAAQQKLSIFDNPVEFDDYGQNNYYEFSVQSVSFIKRLTYSLDFIIISSFIIFVSFIFSMNEPIAGIFPILFYSPILYLLARQKINYFQSIKVLQNQVQLIYYHYDNKIELVFPLSELRIRLDKYTGRGTQYYLTIYKGDTICIKEKDGHGEWNKDKFLEICLKLRQILGASVIEIFPQDNPFTKEKIRQILRFIPFGLFFVLFSSKFSKQEKSHEIKLVLKIYLFFFIAFIILLLIIRNFL